MESEDEAQPGSSPQFLLNYKIITAFRRADEDNLRGDPQILHKFPARLPQKLSLH